MSSSVVDYPWKKEWVNATATVVDHPCSLHSITFNGVTTAGTVTVFDALDGTVPATTMATYNICLLYTSPSPRDRS